MEDHSALWLSREIAFFSFDRPFATLIFRLPREFTLQAAFPICDKVARQIVHLHCVGRVGILPEFQLIALVRPDRCWLPVLHSGVADGRNPVGFGIVVCEAFFVH